MNFRNRNLSGKFFLYFTWFESLAEKCVFIHLLFFRFIRTPWYRCNMHAAAQSHANRIRSKVDWFRRLGEMKHQWTFRRVRLQAQVKIRTQFIRASRVSIVSQFLWATYEKTPRINYTGTLFRPEIKLQLAIHFFFRLLFMFSARPHHNACIVQHIVERRTNGSVIARSRMERPQNYAIN